jgi:hypothetical protein
MVAPLHNFLRIAPTLVALASAQIKCPAAPGSAIGTVDIGAASDHTSGDCSGHSWGHCDSEFDSPACDEGNIYALDEQFVGIAYRQQSSMPQWDGVYVSSCLEVSFGPRAIQAIGIRVVGARAGDVGGSGGSSFKPPERLLTSFYTDSVVKFGGHVPSLADF